MQDHTRQAIENILKNYGLAPGMIVQRDDGSALVTIETTPDRLPDEKREMLEKEIAALEGLSSARVVLTAERAVPQKPSSVPAQPSVISGVRHVVAVASGKGGVGKSTVAVNLALALKALGLKAGLLDADIYGPSQPKMTGLENAGKPELTADKKKIKPFEAFGMPVMSLGFFIDAREAAVWRGPMIQKAVLQMTQGVDWGALDVLVVDLPPGTGDASLTLCQNVRVAGAVIVSTPQDIALIDARKAVNMFEKLHVPVLGIVENMSVYHCPSCGHAEHIFGHGGARAEAEKTGVAFLGEIPLSLGVRQAGDEGRPIMLDGKTSAATESFFAIAKNLQEILDKKHIDTFQKTA